MTTVKICLAQKPQPLVTISVRSDERVVEALHLACAMQAKAQGMVTLDVVLAKNAKRFKVRSVAI